MFKGRFGIEGSATSEHSLQLRKAREVSPSENYWKAQLSVPKDAYFEHLENLFKEMYGIYALRIAA